MQTVKELDLQRYAGKWYEIYRLPFFPERNLINTTATYTILEGGKIEVLNKGRVEKPDGKLKSIKGKAWVPDPENPGRLKVRFFWPFKSDYLVLALDQEEYQYALVAGGSGNVLWFLSRKPFMPEKTVEHFKNVAVENGIDISELIKVPQIWDKD
jgi:lipocalin